MYSYAFNNPLAYSDPSGFCTVINGQYVEDGGQPCPQPPSWSVTVNGGDPASLGQAVFVGDSTCYEVLVDGFDLGNTCTGAAGAGTPPTGGGGGGGNPAPKKTNIFTCASEFAGNLSIAGALQRFGIGTKGIGGFITNALGGNGFSGATDLIQSFATGEGGGHGVLYNMGQGLAAGPSQGFGAALGKSIEGTPWGAGPADVATAALVAKGFAVATGAGQSLQTLNGIAKLGSIGLEAGEFATGFGEAKLAYDAASYAVGLAACAAKKE